MAKKTQQEKQKQKLVDELLKDYDGQESFWGKSGIVLSMKFIR